MVLEQALHDGAQIDRGRKIATFVEIGRLQPWPVGDDPPAVQRTAHQHGDPAGAVIGAIGAIDAGGTAKLGDDRHDGLAPGTTHGTFDGTDSPVESAKNPGKWPAAAT